MPGPISQMSLPYQKHLDALAQHAADNHTAMLSAGQRSWYTPPDWAGDPQTELKDAVTQVFDRQELRDQLAKVLDPARRGTAADLQAILLQTDFLANLERAFRSRYSSKLRRTLHSAGRLESHGRTGGLWKGVFKDLIRNILVIE